MRYVQSTLTNGLDTTDPGGETRDPPG
jgi:hypothetical protein